MIKLIIVTIALLVSGCSTVQVADKCSQTQIVYLKDTYDKLLAERAYIERLDNGAPIPGIVFSFLTREEIINAYKESYNRAVDFLIYQIEQCK